jgi:hypothetical protein
LNTSEELQEMHQKKQDGKNKLKKAWILKI